LTLDTKARKLEKVVPFSEDRDSSGNTKLQCAFSKYLNKEGNFNNQDMYYNLIAGRTTQKAQQQQQQELIQQGRPPDYKITIPALLPGPRCLADASIATDQTTAPHRATAAGLGF
jgi:hypothetical protein